MISLRWNFENFDFIEVEKCFDRNFPPLGTSLPWGKLRPLEGSAPFLGGRPTTMCGPAMVEIHMVVGTQGAVAKRRAWLPNQRTLRKNMIFY